MKRFIRWSMKNLLGGSLGLCVGGIIGVAILPLGSNEWWLCSVCAVVGALIVQSVWRNRKPSA